MTEKQINRYSSILLSTANSRRSESDITEDLAASFLNEHQAVKLIASLASDLDMPEKLTADDWTKIAMALAVDLVKEKSRLRAQVHKTEDTVCDGSLYRQEQSQKKP
ncbi:MAG: hypothetical protein ACXW1Z_19105 [Methylobacter sp.]